MNAAAYPTEHEEQCAVIEWAAYMRHTYPALVWLFAIPNGGARHKAVAAKLVQEGVKRGVPDLFLPYPVGGWHGLWLEMKRHGGVWRAEQKEFCEYARAAGYVYALCWSTDEAIAALTDYLEGKTK